MINLNECHDDSCLVFLYKIGSFRLTFLPLSGFLQVYITGWFRHHLLFTFCLSSLFLSFTFHRICVQVAMVGTADTQKSTPTILPSASRSECVRQSEVVQGREPWSYLDEEQALSLLGRRETARYSQGNVLGTVLGVSSVVKLSLGKGRQPGGVSMYGCWGGAGWAGWSYFSSDGSSLLCNQDSSVVEKYILLESIFLNYAKSFSFSVLPLGSSQRSITEWVCLLSATCLNM